MNTLPASTFARRRVLSLARWVGMFCIVGILLLAGARTLAQTGTTPAPAPATPTGTAPTATGAAAAPAEGEKVTLAKLFWESTDFFTILLVVGSLAGWTIIIICVIEIRRSNIAPAQSEQVVASLARSGRWGELRQFVTDDDAFVSRVVRAAINVPSDDKNAIREAGELAASEESSRWFRKLEPLNVIGNLGPLLGLAGTVWGMIIAFAALGQSGGQANPATLSLGISKALFHTLLGLLLAVPCLCVFGFYRTMVDRICTRAMVLSSEMVELLPASARLRLGDAGGNGQKAAGTSGPGMQPQPRPAAR